MRAKKHIFILDGETPYASSVALALKKDGYAVTVMSSKVSDPLRYSKTCEFIAVEPSIKDEPGSYTKHFYRHLEHNHYDLIMPVSEYGIKLINELPRKIDDSICLVPDASAFEIATHKDKLSRFLDEKKLPQPKTKICRISDALLSENWRYPIIAKPSFGHSGGNLISIMHSQAELQSWIERRQSLEFEFLIQEYIAGFDICASVLCHNGNIVAYTIQQQEGEKKSPVLPSHRMRLQENKNFIEIISQLMANLNWNGVAHIDCRYDQETQEILILEINARFWQTLIASLAANVNFPALLAQMSLNENIKYYGFHEIVFGPINQIGTYLFSKEKYKTQLPYMLYDLRYTLAKFLKK